MLPEDEREGNRWFEPVAILIAVLLVTIVQATNDWSKDRQFRSLNKTKNNFNVKVVRGGEETQIRNYDVLVGDVVILDTGDQVPADGVYISGFDLRLDESGVTGESDPVKKNLERDPFLFSGCRVTDGVGRMLILSTGMNSEWGKLLAALQEEIPPTPLQKRLDKLAAFIGKVGLGFAIATFLALIISWIVKVSAIEWNWAYMIEWVSFMIIAITILVVAIPEGLPLAVTISLAYSMKEMMKDQNLVRHLVACETMGGATTICSDKTGTLTENRMTVVEGWIGGKDFKKVPLKFELPKNLTETLVVGISVNTKAIVNYPEGLNPDFIGNKTECALLHFLHVQGHDYKEVRPQHEVEHLIAFSSSRKRMSTVIRNKKKSKAKGTYRIYCKGASEIILDLCVSYVDVKGEVVALDEEIKKKLNKRINKMAEKGLRTLTLCYKDTDSTNWDREETDMTLVGIVGIMDPIREGVAEAVASCKRAGIVVRMVTGDNVKTATKISEDCGILDGSSGNIIMEGPEFQSLTDEELDAKLPSLRVLARAQPLDKRRLVERLQALGEVVAVTGDGTNDSAALKLADVGLAMGIQGTEVAKEAADIIILDDNFVSIVKAVLWGRNVYDNIRKFIQFQLTVNLVALIIAFVGALSQYGTPLTALQLLWVNLIMDTFAALALGTEKPTDLLLNRKPYGRHSPLLSPIMIRNIVGQCLFQCLVLFIVLYAGHIIWDVPVGKGHHGPSVHYTMVFNTFVFLQIFNEINSRRVTDDDINVFRGIFKNFIFAAVILGTILVQAILVELGGSFTSTTSLPWDKWLTCVGLGALSIPVGLLIRFIPVPEEKHERTKSKKDENEEEMDVQIGRAHV